MRLPGTRYQEHGWEQVRKLLGHCSLQAFRQLDLHQLLDPGQHAMLLDHYTDAAAAALRVNARGARAIADGNSYGDSVHELSLSLLYELQAQPTYWSAFAAAVAAEYGRSGAFWHDAAAEGVLRKKVNDLYAGLRDKVDADHYVVATGRACTPNKIYTYRMLDMAYREIAHLFADWQQHAAQVADILGRDLQGSPIEVRQMKSISGCKADWIIRWSASQERYAGAPGPLHTRSKRFASLKNSPEKIAAMLTEIGDYEELSSNMDRADDWHSSAGAAAVWLEDYWRVLAESEQAEQANAQDGVQQVDQLLLATATATATADADEAPEFDLLRYDVVELAQTASEPEPEPEPDPQQLASEQARAGALALPPRYLELARAAQQVDSWVEGVLAGVSLPIRLAVYQKLLGQADDSYPDAWLDPATGELPMLQQLAALDQISMPTLRKRRNQAIDQLYAANAGIGAVAP